MKITVREDFTPAMGFEFSVATYPGPGVYRNANNLFFVTQTFVFVLPMVNVPEGSIEVTTELKAVHDNTASVSEMTLLKLAAILTESKIAVELLA